MAGKVNKGYDPMYNVVEYFKGVKFKVHGPFEGEWQANNYLSNLPQEDGVEYIIQPA